MESSKANTETGRLQEARVHRIEESVEQKTDNREAHRIIGDNKGDTEREVQEPVKRRGEQYK